jgi:hypothetical protein
MKRKQAFSDFARAFAAPATALALSVWTAPAGSIVLDSPASITEVHEPAAEHCEEAIDAHEFEDAFECGDELFETVFNILDGVGANVGDGGRFTRVPRADLAGTGQWKAHTPARVTGPNAQACNDCHRQPVDDGAGPIGGNVIRDPRRGGVLGQFIQRNTPHVFALGPLQVLAEEMNEDLVNIRANVVVAVCSSIVIGTRRTANLDSKGVNYGTISATRTLSSGSLCPQPFAPRRFSLDTTGVRGVDTDLVVRPFQWKGIEPTVRSFNRGASHNELGMQPVETTGDNVDGDGDGVKNEFSVEDQTALAIYLAGQPRPVTALELDALRGLLESTYGAAGADHADALALPDLEPAQVTAIQHGESVFNSIGCNGCHKASLLINDPIFNEPSANANYRDATFPAGQNPVARGLDPNDPISFDMTLEQPDNIITAPNNPNVIVARLGSLKKNSQGRAIVPLYGDLKRHNMDGLAENVDETGFGAGVWITKELWGAGSSAPYLHDGRSTTISEAIIEHRGEGQASRDAFLAQNAGNRADLVAFIENLLLYKVPEE